jgi:hypothetical protein
MASMAPAFIYSDESPSKVACLVRALVRDIRAEAQNIRLSAQVVQEKGALKEPKTREDETRNAFKEFNDIFNDKDNKGRVEQLFDELHATLRANPEQYDATGDEVTEIENNWERVCKNLPLADDPIERILNRVQIMVNNLDEMILHCGLITIPSRVEDHLKQLRSGQSLDFNEAFQDELPKLEDRIKVLRFLYSHPAAISGVVDVEHGLIYCASPKLSRRRLSYVYIAITVLLGAGVGYAYLWLKTQSVPTWNQYLPLLKAYIALMLGSLAHILINGVKQARAESRMSFVAVDDWLMWVHIKETAIMAGVVSLWIGLIGLAYLKPQAGDIPAPEIGTAFFVGYSIDSFVELFLERFTTIATTKTNAITAQLAKTN